MPKSHQRSALGGRVPTVLACLMGAASALAAADGAADFNHQIRPLLSDRCFKCHGPDEKSRKATLRLDTREGAMEPLKGGLFAIKPGDPARSEVMRRITSLDPDDQMPPPESKLSLSAAEIEWIRRWIAQGARYAAHWSFQPVEPVAVPTVKDASRARNPIDSFVLARLEREGIESSPEAGRETLLRRLTLDLLGLPPALREIDEFLADDSPGAYEEAVDRLLRSTAYGERMANDWLDLARYADTYGYQADVDFDMSPWRDWVIRAFNENLPFDQFILWQLAGDLLPEATRDQILATAFNRLHRQTNEGGSIEEEFRVEYVSDRVHTMGTAFLGLTLECARCHDHKYDPITQRDYYRLFAFFNNIDESGLYSHFTRATPSPTLLLYEEGAAQRHAALKRSIEDAEHALQTSRREAGARFEDWLGHAREPASPPIPVAMFHFDDVDENKSPNALDAQKPAELRDGPELVEGRSGRALRFSGDNEAVCKGSGEFGRADAFSFSLWLRPTEAQPRAVVFHRSRAWTDSASRGYELLLEDGRPAFHLVHFWPGNAMGVRALEPLPLNEWSHLVITYDGSSQARGVRIYRNGAAMSLETVRDHLFKDIVHRKEWGDGDVGNVHLTLAGRFRDAGFKHGLIDELRVFDRRLTGLEAALLPGERTKPIPREVTFEHFLARHDEHFQREWARLNALRQEESDVADGLREIMVMRELADPRPAYVLKRGAYDAPGDAVQAGAPERIFPFAAELPRNRLGLARWMTDRRNPLTARVAVNRAWKLHFGRGLVATVEDFGSQGGLPSHPALLDWLAGWFMDHGWDRKALHKLIAMSATYRQSSQARPELVARDPDNRLLARGPKHRLQAEQIRDSALAAAGLLNPKLGGRSVYPYQPAGLWEESGTGKSYRPSKGADLYRRSLYTFWRRTAPPPSMLTFDATSREVCTARREVTATPLQALVLLNDPQYVEAARALAERLMLEQKDDLTAALRDAFRRLTGRHPEPPEVEVLQRLYREQLDHFERDPRAAAHYLAMGERPPDPALPPARVAALAVVANALMNYDAFVMKR